MPNNTVSESTTDSGPNSRFLDRGKFWRWASLGTAGFPVLLIVYWYAHHYMEGDKLMPLIIPAVGTIVMLWWAAVNRSSSYWLEYRDHLADYREMHKPRWIGLTLPISPNPSMYIFLPRKFSAALVFISFAEFAFITWLLILVFNILAALGSGGHIQPSPLALIMWCTLFATFWMIAYIRRALMIEETE